MKSGAVVSRIISLRYPDGRHVQTPRDAAGRVASLSDTSGTYVSYRYFGSGRLLEKKLASGVVLSFLRPDPDGIPRSSPYDPASEVLEHVYSREDGATLYGLEYGRDRAGFKQYERIMHGADQGRGRVWRYDSVYRIFKYLPDVFDPRVPPDDPTKKLVFYPNGNHSWRFIEVDFTQRHLTVNPRGAYMTSDDQTFDYDFAGNLRSAEPLSFAYDAFRRLVRVEREGETVGVYGYDASECEDPWEFSGRGRRVSKDVALPVRGQPAGLLRHTYWGEHLIEERDVSGQLLRQYLQEEGRPAVMIAHSLPSPATAYSFLHDASGSVVMVLDPLGVNVEELRYGLHGTTSVLRSSAVPLAFSSVSNAFAFGGFYHDYELGFHLAGVRYFDPQLGRFLTDGSPLLPSAPLELNGYQYPGIPGVSGEITGKGSRRRGASYLKPFEVKLLPRDLRDTHPRCYWAQTPMPTRPCTVRTSRIPGRPTWGPFHSLWAQCRTVPQVPGLPCRGD